MPFIATIVLTGCAAPARMPPPAQTSVAYRAVDNAGTKHYELSEDQAATIPTAIDMPAPAYPPAMVVHGIAHVSVLAQVVVDEAGNVGDVRIRPDDTARPIDFDDAVRAAVSRWRYQPLRFQQWEEVHDQQGNVIDSRLTQDEAKPFSLEYEFSFDLRNGQPSVSTNQASAK